MFFRSMFFNVGVAKQVAPWRDNTTVISIYQVSELLFDKYFSFRTSGVSFSANDRGQGSQ